MTALLSLPKIQRSSPSERPGCLAAGPPTTAIPKAARSILCQIPIQIGR